MKSRWKVYCESEELDTALAMMDSHTRRLLEFDHVLERVKLFCFGEYGAHRMEHEEFCYSSETLDTLKQRVSAAMAMLEHVDSWPALSFPEIDHALELTRKEGGVLEPEDIAAVAVHARSGVRLRSLVVKFAGETPLRDIADEVPQLDKLSEELLRYIDEDGTIHEKQVPALQQVTRKLRSAQRKVEELASRYMQSSEMRDYWTSDVPTQRDGRTVLPMQARYRNRMSGAVHEVSSTGATVFIEPTDLMERNNEVRLQEEEYRRELLKLLRELTARVAEHREELTALRDAAAHLDSILARARFGRKHECAMPECGQDTLRLEQARHPLLGPEVVPIDVELDSAHPMLVVTGPNTGGKTVALKTVGLMVLMHQFGIPLPAGERSVLPLTDAVYADIGDEQSIAQSLSTFSGHMTTIASILESATGASLVLLDELGAGTDPEEGSSLAMAILDSLRERRCYSLVTTHHSALKSYAYRHDEVVNASVEFDTDTLEPTYHLLTGVPGSSHAMTIAERTGLSSEVVNAARKYLEENQSDAAQIIQKLTEEQTALREQQKEQDEQWRNLQRERENLEERKRDLDQREVRLEEGYLQDFERFQSETRKQLENLVRELREGELTKDKTQRVKSFLDGLSRTKEQEQRRVDKRKRDTEREAAEAQELKPGMTVRMKGPGKRGVIQRRGKGDRWVVQMDNMTVTVPEAQLEPAERPRKRGDAGYSVTITGGDGSPPSHELDVRGMRLEEARSTVERQIDQALLSGLSWFEIIHGKGEGVLQQGIRELLKSHPSVAEYSFAPTDQGGHGKTVVQLRQESP